LAEGPTLGPVTQSAALAARPQRPCLSPPVPRQPLARPRVPIATDHHAMGDWRRHRRSTGQDR